MCNEGEEIRFIGVRKRKWGKYVAEIRSGKRSRIALGSYFTAEAAARAYDTALLCLRGPHASSFNFPDSQFNSTAVNVANAQNNLSARCIRTAAIAVGSEFDKVPARYHHHNFETGSSADKEASAEFGQAVYGLNIADNVEEEEDMDEANDTKYLLQSPEEISIEERVQMSLLLPEEEMLQPYNPSEIFPELGILDKTIFQTAPAKPRI